MRSTSPPTQSLTFPRAFAATDALHGPALRFLGPSVYIGPIVVLVAVLLHDGAVHAGADRGDRCRSPHRRALAQVVVQGRRRLGLDGREHDGTLARHGYGRLPLRSISGSARVGARMYPCLHAVVV